MDIGCVYRELQDFAEGIYTAMQYTKDNNAILFSVSEHEIGGLRYLQIKI